MNLKLFDNWADGNVIAGYTVDCGGRFRHHNPQDKPNYSALAKELGLTSDRMVRVSQSHSTKIFIAGSESGGEGILKLQQTESFDGILTNEEDLILCLTSADCVPVFLYDKEKRAIGLVHSGRRGTMKEIVCEAVLQMQREYLSEPKDIHCIFGPYLCTFHHVVDRVDAAPFYESFSPAECESFLTEKDGRVYVDMGKAITLSLIRSGLPEENIYDSRICTFEQKELYSWRRDHTPDAQILSFILLKRK